MLIWFEDIHFGENISLLDKHLASDYEVKLFIENILSVFN